MLRQRRCCGLLTLLLVCSMWLQASVPPSPEDHGKGEKQSAVYSALLNMLRFPKSRSVIWISELTLNRGCGDHSGNPVRFNDCGMFSPPSNVDGIHRELIAQVPTLDGSTWSDLLSVTRSSGQVRLTTPLRDNFAVVNLENPGGAGAQKPDGIALLSQVGFNKSEDEALVYIMFLSYMDPIPTGGDLFVFRFDHKENHWGPAARITLMQTVRASDELTKGRVGTSPR